MTYSLISRSAWSKQLLRTSIAAFTIMLLACQPTHALELRTLDLIETPMLAERVQAKTLPPVAERIPATPLIVDLAARNREPGRHGGDIITLVARSRDIRYVSAYSYARLIGYDADLNLQNDLVEHIEVEGERVFTFKLRAGHRWSDGHPFTSEDMRYWWEDVANSKDLSPAGPPEFMMVNGKPPRFEVLDKQRVRYTWDAPNPRFLPTLAQPRDPFIYRPAHYLKPFHARYGDSTKLDVQARGLKMKSWATLHNRVDDMFENSNPALPTLQAWRITNAAPATRFVFERNPYYHRIDAKGRQLPYLDRIIADVATGGLMAAKANAGEADLLARGLNMNDMPILKEGEKAKNYRTLLWPIGRGSEVTLFPNLTVSDPVWRTLNRDVRFRRALSLAIDRRTLNNSLMFGLGVEGNNTVREGSTLSSPELRKQWAVYDRTRRRGHPPIAGWAGVGDHCRS
jgi:peptide/nickel transport system substrate-binding protein